jgi:adenylate cyclase
MSPAQNTLSMLQSAWRSLGRFPAHLVTWVLALAFCGWAVLDATVLHVGSGLAESTYDAMVRFRVHAQPVDPRIVIVDIDEASLAAMGKEFGQWPWPRDTLATVLAHIEKQQPAAVLWDMVFSDPDLQNPGGDAAFNAVAASSLHSHFSVVRLPPENDRLSQIRRADLPGLWAADGQPGATTVTSTAATAATAPNASTSPTTSAAPSTVALIPPALPAVAAARLGYNNGYVDKDGVLRRYRFAERLPDGSTLMSIAASVQRDLNPSAWAQARDRATLATQPAHKDALIAWRAEASAYPRVRFVDVFAQAEGADGSTGLGAKEGANNGEVGASAPGTSPKAVPSFQGKVVLIGSTAPSLHDIHPTPLSPYQHGVDTLATVVDNAINGHSLYELPAVLQAALACVFFLGIALWVSRRGVSSLAPITFALPGLLLLISYASLNGLPVFVDLHIAAGLGLLLLAALRTWNALRRDYWCRWPVLYTNKTVANNDAISAWTVRGAAPWTHAKLDRLLSAVQHHAPDCRVVVGDDSFVWPARIGWPDLAQIAAVIGPPDALHDAAPALQAKLGLWLEPARAPLLIDASAATLFPALFQAWADLHRAAAPTVTAPTVTAPTVLPAFLPPPTP